MAMNAPPATPADTALLLTGGGARAAYQVGVLQALTVLRRRSAPGAPAASPFGIIAGTSAGAINAAALACGADRFSAAVSRLARIWRGFHTQQVYRSGALEVARAGTHWIGLMALGWALARYMRAQPRSLLDNAPLGELLRAHAPLDRLPLLLAQGHLRALAITATSYTTDDHVMFYQALEPMRPWVRAPRLAVRTQIGVEHLMASSAIPFLFPAAAVGTGAERAYYGDGAIRQVAPIAPVIHLGARRVLVVGTDRLREPGGMLTPPAAPLEPRYPSLGQVAGHVLSSLFLDALSVDIGRVRRINHTLSLVAPERRHETDLREIELLAITPSQPLDAIALRHLDKLPSSVRALLATLGTHGRSRDTHDAALASYLLFEAEFTRELIQLGHADTLARRGELCGFFGWTPL